MKSFLLLALLCLMAASAWASHLLGGQIQTKNTSGNAYEITVVLYMDEENGRTASDATSSVPVCLGDGTTVNAVRATRRIVGQNISVNVYRFYHTYNGPGIYQITTSLANRTTMVNLTQANESAFSLTTTIQAIGNRLNSTPVFEPSPDFLQVGVNQRSTLSFQATDADGDSLSYALVKPLTSASSNTCTTPISVSQYVFPNDVSKKGTYKLNSRTGELVWDAPTTAGQYLAAILVREWRNRVQISESYIETFIRVQDKPGTPSPIPPYQPATETPAIITSVEANPESEFVFTISPNPIQSQLVARFRSNKPTTVQFQLLDLSGRVVAEKVLVHPRTDHELILPVENLASGVYILKAVANDRVVNRKVMKQ